MSLAVPSAALGPILNAVRNNISATKCGKPWPQPARKGGERYPGDQTQHHYQTTMPHNQSQHSENRVSK